MANRSYLFSAPELPAAMGELPRPIRGISEYNYAIPWVHKVLISATPQRCASTIWNPAICLAGDYDGGVAKLNQWVQQLRAGGAVPAALSAQIDKALAFLSQPKSRQKYFLLEAGEIFSLYGGDVEGHAQALLQEVQSLSLSALSLSREHLGFDAFWSHVLYFSFKE